MATITLRDINLDNWQDIIKLEMHDHQKHYTPSPLYAMAHASVEPGEMHLKAIYADETPVGYIMHGYNPNAPGGLWAIWHFMIDKNHQRKGYGRVTIQQVIDHYRERPDVDKVYLLVAPDNDPAKELYESFGFQPTGQVIFDELEYCLDLEKDHTPKSPVTLKPLTEDLFRQAVELKVAPHQRNFVAPNVNSIALAYFYPEHATVDGIFAGDEMVGFTLYTKKPLEGRSMIVRFMIGAGYQGMGYGKKAMNLLIDRFKSQEGCTQVFLTVVPQNTAAKKLYESVGFRPTGVMRGDEEEYRLALD